MRDHEAGFGELLVAVEQQVEVDRARPVAGPLARPPQCALDLEQAVEEDTRRLDGLELGDGVEEARLVGIAPRLRLEQRGDTRGAEELQRSADRRLAVAEVGPEPDVRERHGRSTVTALNSTGSATSGLRTRTRTRSRAKRA